MLKTTKLTAVLAIAGLILALAPAAQAALILGATSTAKDEGATRVASNIADGTGLSGTAFTGDWKHNNVNDDMWLGADAKPTWVTVDLGGSYTVADMYFWNYKETNPTTAIDRQISTYNLWYSNDDTATPGDFTDVKWSQLGGTITAAIVPDSVPYLSEMIDMQDKTAKVIGLEILTGTGSGTGLAALQFDGTAIPEPSTMGLLALSGLALLRRRRA